MPGVVVPCCPYLTYNLLQSVTKYVQMYARLSCLQLKSFIHRIITQPKEAEIGLCDHHSSSKQIGSTWTLSVDPKMGRFEDFFLSSTCQIVTTLSIFCYFQNIFMYQCSQFPSNLDLLMAIQGFRKYTRSDMCESMLGLPPLVGQTVQRKLMFYTKSCHYRQVQLAKTSLCGVTYISLARISTQYVWKGLYRIYVEFLPRIICVT